MLDGKDAVSVFSHVRRQKSRHRKSVW